jgi:hypothetical protein
MVELGGLDFREWVFSPGMEYGARNLWWGRLSQRPIPHQGVDIALYRSRDGGLRSLASGSVVPLAAPGRIVAVIEDFIGRTVVAMHGEAGDGCLLYTLYGHLAPRTGVLGEAFEGGEPVGAVARPRGEGVPPHLHLSVAEVPESVSPDTLAWGWLERSPLVRFRDPAGYLA